MRIAIPLLATALGALLACVATHDEASSQRAGVSSAPGLSAEARLALAAEPALRDELALVLDEYFGPPDAPRYRLLEAWDAWGFDPNSGPLSGERPASELRGAPPEAILADNRRYWANELAALRFGDPNELGPWDRRVAMNRAWEELLARRATLGPGAFGARAQAFFAERSPDLREAAGLFLPNCARCHGRAGGGDGPMAAHLRPRPRDYRAGVFKFAAVEGGSKPRRVDILRTLVQGLPGSAMPSFRNVSLAELSALVDYVRYLSIRGEVEAMLVAEWERAEVRPREAVAELYELVWERWLEADEYAELVEAPEPDDSPARYALGESIFHDRARGNCVSCHGPEGRGDGPSALRRGEDGELYAILRDEWGDAILPRDLTNGVFRGGERREDVYLRIHCGIPGTPMSALGSSVDASGDPLLTEEEKWALVDYVLSLSGHGPFAEQER